MSTFIRFPMCPKKLMNLYHILGTTAPNGVLTRVHRCGCMHKVPTDFWVCPYSEKMWYFHDVNVKSKINVNQNNLMPVITYQTSHT